MKRVDKWTLDILAYVEICQQRSTAELSRVTLNYSDRLDKMAYFEETREGVDEYAHWKKNYQAVFNTCIEEGYLRKAGFQRADAASSQVTLTDDGRARLAELRRAKLEEVGFWGLLMMGRQGWLTLIRKSRRWILILIPVVGFLAWALQWLLFNLDEEYVCHDFILLNMLDRCSDWLQLQQ